MKTITKNIGIFAAASILLLAGFLSTWGMLHWWNQEPQLAGYEIDLSQDPRIVTVQQSVPFQLALPTWMPKDYILSSVGIISPGTDDISVELHFEGPAGSEPILISQSYKFEHNAAPSLEFVQFKGIEPLWLTSNYTGWGTGTRNDLGYYFESDIQGKVRERKLVFITDVEDIFEDRTYITISSGAPINQSRVPEKIVSTDTFLAMAKGIKGAESVYFLSPDDELVRNWALVKPNYLPSGFKLASLDLSASIKDRFRYSGRLVYHNPTLADPTAFLGIKQWHSEEPVQRPENAEEIMLDTVHGSVTGYYDPTSSHSAMTFSVEGPSFFYNFELYGVPTPAKAELVAIAESITHQYDRLPIPTRSIGSFYVPPTTHSLSFGPNGFVGYIPAEGNIARLWISGESYQLPGTYGDYSQVWWQGEKILYYVEGFEDNDVPFYLYDTRNHSHESFADKPGWSDLGQPAMLNDSIVAVFAPDGIWAYSLTEESWHLLVEVDKSSIKEFAWSPDASRVAWIESENTDKIVVLDIASGNRSVVYESKEILALAWSLDGQLAAITESNTGTGIIWDGDITTFDVNYFRGNLGWVPSKDILFYQDIGGLALNHLKDGKVIHVNVMASYDNYAWMPDGNLALFGDIVTIDGEEMQEILIQAWR